MCRIVASFLFGIWLLPLGAGADPRPAKGMLLVATDVIREEVFAETVILLLHYDANGAMGLVVNRPTDVAPEEIVIDAEAFAAYGGTLYWGGPVRMGSLRALMLTDAPPEESDAIVESVHLVHIDAALSDASASPANLRFFIGYAGWAPGQLDRELARGSWHVMPAADDYVFAEDPRQLWQRLAPPSGHRVAVPSSRTRT